MKTDDIKNKAQEILQYLKNYEYCPLEQLKNELDLNDKNLYLALGWLAYDKDIDFCVCDEIQYIFIIPKFSI